jgi:hypothetical protein
MTVAMTGGPVAGGSPVVFVSYSRKDAKWRDKFLVMLAPDVRERRVEVWSDQREVVGEEWRPQLEQAIGRARAALLLVSPDFLASEFVMGEELPALIARGATLVCALVKPCRWQTVAALERVQWAHDPARALTQQRDRDGAIVRICEKLIQRLPAGVAEPPHDVEDARGRRGGGGEGRVGAVSVTAGMGGAGGRAVAACGVCRARGAGGGVRGAAGRGGGRGRGDGARVGAAWPGRDR